MNKLVYFKAITLLLFHMMLFRKTSVENLCLLTARPAVKKMFSDGTETHWYRSERLISVIFPP